MLQVWPQTAQGEPHVRRPLGMLSHHSWEKVTALQLLGNYPPSQVREAQETLVVPLQLHLSWGPNYAPEGPSLVTGLLVT